MFQLNLGSDDKCPEEILPSPVTYTETLLFYGIVSCSGILSFIATGTNKNIYSFFAALINCIWKREWKRFVDLVTLDNKRLQRTLPLATVPTVCSTTSVRSSITSSFISSTPPSTEPPLTSNPEVSPALTFELTRPSHSSVVQNSIIQTEGSSTHLTSSD
jgi:hypothetical protein